MSLSAIIISIVVTVAGIVTAAFITGTVVYLINSLKDMIKENALRSETGDHNIKNEMQIMHSQNVTMRKEDRERYDGDLKALKNTDEDRRQDIRKIYDIVGNLKDSIHENKHKMLEMENATLKKELENERSKTNQG
jgi:hypothetical protein